ncbi:MAG: hypothetical protein JST55_11890 [Bacteroidetes bacterium]|nr:hypothetical protein [Bacteroidota bacterium]
MKQKTIRLFFAVFVLSVISLSNLYAQDKLIGTWERTGDDLAGAQVKVFKTGSTFKGKIVFSTQAMKEACFDVGEIKWMNIIKAGKGYYEMDDLSKSSSCDSWYAYKYIEFTDDSHITITSMTTDPTTSGNFQTWTKISDD